MQSTLKDYAFLKNSPTYRAIVQHFRQKVRGPADAALVAYNIYDDEWSRIKQCLSLHYVNKRNVRTLQQELNLIRQGGKSIVEFYARINH